MEGSIWKKCLFRLNIVLKYINDICIKNEDNEFISNWSTNIIKFINLQYVKWFSNSHYFKLRILWRGIRYSRFTLWPFFVEISPTIHNKRHTCFGPLCNIFFTSCKQNTYTGCPCCACKYFGSWLRMPRNAKNCSTGGLQNVLLSSYRVFKIFFFNF